MIPITRVVTTWADSKAPAHRILTSTDGTTWTERRTNPQGTLQAPVDARYVRVEVTGSGTTHPSLRELAVN